MLEGSGQFPAGTRITVPMGVAAFADPVFPPPPRSLVEKTYAVAHWTEMAKGGHFAAVEQPGLLLADLRAFLTGCGSGFPRSIHVGGESDVDQRRPSVAARS